MSKIWQVVIGTGSVILATPFLVAFGLKHFGLINSFSDKALLIVGAAILSIWVKIGLQAYASEMYFCKQGYDLCIVTLGTALTTAASEWLPSCGHPVDINRIGLLFLTFVVAMILTLLTGRIVRDFEALLKLAPATTEGLSSATSFTMGSILFLANIFFLITRT